MAIQTSRNSARKVRI